MSRYARDSQRQKVYKAENRALNWAHISDQAAVDYLRKVESSRFVKSQWPKYRGNATVTFRKMSRKLGTARVWYNELTFRRGEASEPLVLHELAHLLTPGAKHGPAFVSAYLKLVKRFMGVEAHARLKAAFLERGVKTKVMPKRRLSHDAREALAARMRQVRERHLQAAAKHPEPRNP